MSERIKQEKKFRYCYECDGFPCARVKRADKYEYSNYTKKAAWWRGAILRLEKEVGKETAIKIMESCGRKCCGGTYRKRANL